VKKIRMAKLKFRRWKKQKFGRTQRYCEQYFQTISSITAAVQKQKNLLAYPLKKLPWVLLGNTSEVCNIQITLCEKIRSLHYRRRYRSSERSGKKLVMLPGEEIIHVLPQEYKVDSEGEIQEPIGMHGKRLKQISTLL
jgi:cell division protein FtsA